MEKPALQHIECGEGKVGGLEESPIIALIDQRALVRELVGSFLRERMPEFVVHQAASLAEIESRRSFAYRIFVIFQPAASAELAKTYIQVARLRQVFPSAPVIVVSDFARSDLVCEAFRCGASGFIPTLTSVTIFAQAIRTVLAGGEYVPASVLEGSGPAAGLAGGRPLGRKFTPRQQQVLGLLREGLPNKVIAYRLDMRESTVKVHLRQIMRKMNATNRTQVVAAFNDGRGFADAQAGLAL
jgi:DNA-binding NarL/FixJ family response regulator